MMLSYNLSEAKGTTLVNLRYNIREVEHNLSEAKGTTLVKLRYNLSDVEVQP